MTINVLTLRGVSVIMGLESIGENDASKDFQNNFPKKIPTR